MSEPHDPAGTAPEGLRPSRLRRLGWGLLYGLGALAGVLLLLVLLLQTPWGARQAVRLIEAQVSRLMPEATLTIEHLDGNFLTHLKATGIEIRRQDEIVARVDSADIGYALWPLLRKTVHLRRVALGQTHLALRQDSSGAWNLATLFADPAAPPDTSASAWTVRIDEAVVGAATADIYPLTPAPDSVLHARSFQARLRDVVLGPTRTHARLDTLRTLLDYPSRPEPLELVAAGTVSDTAASVTYLRLTSAVSHVEAGGVLEWQPASLHRSDFTLRLEPLAFADLKPFLPYLDPNGAVSGDVALKGAPDGLYAHADLEATDGMELDLDARLAALGPPESPDPAQSVYRVEGRLRRLNPTYLFGERAGRGLINADLNVDLAGPSPQRLNGVASLTVFDTEFEGETVPRGRLESTFEDGTTHFLLDARIFGGRVAAEGWVRPFEDPVSYEAAARLDEVEIERSLALMLEHPPALTGRLTGTLDVRGEGTDPRTAALEAEVRLRDTRINQTDIDRGTLDLRLAGGRMAFRADAGLAQRASAAPVEGALRLDGEVLFPEDGEPLRYRLTDGAFDHLDLAALFADPALDSDLTGRLTLDGQGTDPRAVMLGAVLRMEEGRFGTFGIREADLQIRFRQATLEATGTADLDGARLALEASAQPLLARPTFEASASFQEADVGRLFDLAEQASALNGDLAVSGSGTSADDLQLDATLRLDASRYNEQAIRSGTLRATLQARQLDVQADFDFPQGGVELSAVAQPFADPVRFEVEQGSFRRLDLGAWLDNPAVSTDLNGRIEQLAGLGTDPATMELDALLQLGASRINRERVRDGQVILTMREGVVRLDANTRLSRGSVLLAGEGRFFDEVPGYEALGRLVDADLPALLGLDSLDTAVNLAFSLAGTGFDPRTLEMRGVLTGGRSTLVDAEIDTALVDFSIVDGRIQVDTLLVRSNVTDIHGGGQLAVPGYAATRTSNFTFDADVKALQPLRRLLGAAQLDGVGQLTGRAFGTETRLRFEVVPEIEYLIYNSMRLSGLDGSFRGEVDSLLTLETDLRLGFLATPTASIQQTDLELTYARDTLVFRTDILADRRREVRIAGWADVRGEDRMVMLDRLDVRLDRDRWQLLQPTPIAVGPQIQVGNLLLYAGTQQISIGGVLDPEGDQTLLIATVEGLRAGAVTDLFGYSGLDGLTEVYLTLTGPPEALLIDGSVRLTDITSEGQPVGSMDARLDYSDDQLRIDARLLRNDGNTLSARGSVPTRITLTGISEAPADTPIRFTVRADTFGIDWVQPFIDPELVTAIGGDLTAAVDISGTQGDPELGGTLKLERGMIELPVANIPYRDIQIDATLDGNVMTISRGVLRSDPGRRLEGRMEAQGTVEFQTLTRHTYDLDLTARQFKAIHDETYRGVVGGTFKFGGTTLAPVLTGSAVLGPFDIYLTDELTAEELEPIRLTPRDLQILEERFGYRISADDTTTFDFYEALRMDLDVEMGNDVWLRSARSPKMDIEFTGTLDFRKVPYGEEEAYGTITVNPRRSYLRQYGKRFSIARGSLRFNGALEEMIIDLLAEYRVPARQGEEGPTIQLSIAGRADDLKIDLQSEEVGGRQLDATEVLSYIATGQPPGEGLFGGSNSSLESTLEDQAASFAFGQLSTLVDGVAGEELGLDVIEIETDGVRGVTLTVGKYITLTIGDRVLPTLYATVRQPISLTDGSGTANTTRTSEVSVEFEVFRKILLRLGGGRNQEFRFNLLFEYAY